MPPAATREPLVSTGLPSIDRMLGGGLPCGSLVTFEGNGTAGCRSIAAALLAMATQRGLGAIIDEGDLYPPALEAAGVRLERLLIVPAKTPIGVARAADLLLRSRIARVVVMAATSLRAAVWMRLASLAQKAGAILVVLAPRASAELCGAALVRVHCRIGTASASGTHGLWGVFTGFDVRAELRKHKHAMSGASA
jgi:cell division inhibitor SulA/protein ImuA